MTPEDKELLFKDLCARVPYHPKGHVVNACNGAQCDEWLTCATFPMFTCITNNCRLYLRPMSSMTKEEKEELNCLCYHNIDVQDGMLCGYICAGEINDVIDWLNKYHFDYRGLIEKGLAIKVTEDNNPYKE